MSDLRCSFKDGADSCLRPAQFRKATGEQACERHALLVNWVRVRVEIEPNVCPIEDAPAKAAACSYCSTTQQPAAYRNPRTGVLYCQACADQHDARYVATFQRVP